MSCKLNKVIAGFHSRACTADLVETLLAWFAARSWESLDWTTSLNSCVTPEVRPRGCGWGFTSLISRPCVRSLCTPLVSSRRATTCHMYLIIVFPCSAVAAATPAPHQFALGVCRTSVPVCLLDWSPRSLPIDTPGSFTVLLNICVSFYHSKRGPTSLR